MIIAAATATTEIIILRSEFPYSGAGLEKSALQI